MAVTCPSRDRTIVWIAIDVVYPVASLGSLRFTSNQGVYGPYGAAQGAACAPNLHNSVHVLASVNHTDHGMSSASITH